MELASDPPKLEAREGSDGRFSVINEVCLGRRGDLPDVGESRPERWGETLVGGVEFARL